MRKYFIWTDWIIIVAFVFSLIWIILYKLYWIESSYQIFSNADKWGEITFTILTSVLASCIFYIISIYLPRINKIRKYEQDISLLVLHIGLDIDYLFKDTDYEFDLRSFRSYSNKIKNTFNLFVLKYNSNIEKYNELKSKIIKIDIQLKRIINLYGCILDNKDRIEIIQLNYRAIDIINNNDNTEHIFFYLLSIAEIQDNLNLKYKLPSVEQIALSYDWKVFNTSN